MAHFYVRNSLNYDQTVKINISFVRGYDVTANDGDPRWFLELATTHTTASGTKIAPQFVNNVTNKFKLDELIAEAVANIAAQIDWAPLVSDNKAPYIYDALPSEISCAVPIESNIDIVIKDAMPSSGLDLGDLLVTISTNSSTFNITDACVIEGNPFEYRIHWEPPFRKYEYYGG
jgi:hypothetical protein